jgi:subtilase family serine protease
VGRTPREAAWRLSLSPDPLTAQALLTAQASGGGFGPAPGHVAATLETAECLLATAEIAGVPRIAMAAASAALLRLQRPDGGYSASGDVADLATTALAVRALAAVADDLPVEPGLLSALAWLRARPPRDALDTALRADALAAAGRLEVGDVVELTAAQTAPGVWSDVQGTAAALRALVAAAPNLRIRTAALERSEIASGMSFELDLEVENDGLEATPSTSVRVEALEPGVGPPLEVEVPALAPGARHTLRVSLPGRASPGTQSIQVAVDPGYTIVERDETDNDARLQGFVRASAPPDLEVRPEDVLVAPWPLARETPFEVVVRVRNRGDERSAAVSLDAHLGAPGLGGRRLAVAPVPALDGHTDVTLRLPVEGLPEGASTLVVRVDPAEAGPDAFRDNNRSSRTLRVVGGADLALLPAGLRVDPGPVVAVGDRVELHVAVQNRGTAASVPTEVWVSDAGGPSLAAAPVPALAPGETVYVSLPVFPDEARAYTYFLEVDPEDRVIERDEVDNLLAARVRSDAWNLTLEPPPDASVARTGARGQWSVAASVFSTSVRAAPGVVAEVRLDAPEGRALGRRACGGFAAAPVSGRSSTQCVVSFRLDALTPGPHTFFLCVDVDDTLAETDETDNCTVQRVEVAAPPDFGIELQVAASVTPDALTEVRFRLVAPPYAVGQKTLRVHADGRSLYFGSPPIDQWQSASWRAPDVRGESRVVATLEAEAGDPDGDGYSPDPNPADNRVERRVEVGGAPRIIGVRATDAAGVSEPLRGRLGRLEVMVDAPTQVEFAGTARLATPASPAVFDWQPLVAGRQQVSVRALADAAPTPFGVRVLADVLPAPLVSAVAEDAHVTLDWPVSPDSGGFLVFRDGRPLGPVDRVVASAPPDRLGRLLTVGSDFEFELPAPTWIGAIDLDLGIGAGNREGWRVWGRARGRWRLLHAESSGPGAAPRRVFDPAEVDRVRFEYPTSADGDRGSMRLVRFDLLGPRTLSPPFVDETLGVARSTYAVAEVRGSDQGPWNAGAVEVQVPLGPFEIQAEVDRSEVRLSAAAEPRVTAWRIEVDGLPLADEPLAANVLDASLGVGEQPRVFEAEWFLRTRTPPREAWLRLRGPREVERIDLTAPGGWQAFDLEGRAVVPGPLRDARLFWPGEGPDPERTLDVRVRGPLVVEGPVLDFARTLPLGAHVLTVVPLDTEGRAGSPTDVPVQVDTGPPPLAQVAARFEANGSNIAVTWTAAPVHAEVLVTVDDGPPTRVPAQGGRFAVRADRGPGLWRFRLVPFDAAGNSGPESLLEYVHQQALPEVTLVAAQVAGFRITASWAAAVPGAGQPRVHSYEVLVNGVVVGTPGASPFQFTHRAAGRHRLEVRPRFGNAATLGHLSAPVHFEVADDGPPPTPTLLPVASWPTTGSDSFSVRWAPLNTVDLERFDVEVNGEPELLTSPAGGIVRTVPWRLGVRRYDVRLRAVDGTGHTSPWTSATLALPPARALRLTTSGLADDGTVGFAVVEPAQPLGGYSGYWLRRGGERVCRWQPSHFQTEATALPGGGAALTLERGVWVSRAGQPPWAVDLVAERTGTATDRVRLDFGRADTRAVDFTLEVLEPPFTWRTVATVRDNAEVALVLELPTSPRVAGERLRLRVERVTESGLLNVHRFDGERCDAPRPFVDAAAPPGPLVYDLVPLDVAGDPGAPSAAVAVVVPRVDLGIENDAFALSDDEWQVGDDVAVIVPVVNTGAAAAAQVEVRLEVAPQRCGVQARALSSARVDVPADTTVPVVLPWAVDTETGVLCVEVDPEDEVAEALENNNLASRGVAADLEYRTQGYSPGGLTLFPCAAESRWVVRWGAPAAVLSGVLRAGELVDLSPVRGAFTLSTDRPVSALVGPTFGVTSSLVRDCADSALVTDAFADVPLTAAGFSAAVSVQFPTLFVWSPQGPATLLAVESQRRVGGLWRPSGLEVLRQAIAPGTVTALNPHTLTDESGQPRATGLLRVTSDRPLALWSYADLGFPFVGPDGLSTGSTLTGFVGRSSSLARAQQEEVVLASYTDENRFEVIRTDTGARVQAGLLPRYGLASVTFAHGQGGPNAPVPLEVRASGRLSAVNMSLVSNVPYGYVHAFYVPGESGRMIDTRFVVPISPNAGPEDTVAIFAFYDGTALTVTAPNTGEALVSTVLSRGGSVDLLDTALVSPRLERRRLLVESEGPVAIFQSLGSQGAEFAPMLWAPGHRADLRIVDLVAEPTSPRPGEPVEVRGRVENAGARRARDVELQVRAGAADDGPFVHRSTYGRLDAGRPAPFSFVVAAGEAPLELRLAVDPDDRVEETDEGNNAARLRLGAALNLAAAAVLAEPHVGVPGHVTVRIANPGGVDVPEADALVEVDGARLGRVRFAVAAGQSVERTLPWTPVTPGPAALRLTVDPDARLDQTRRDDDVVVARVEVAPAEDAPTLTLELEPRGPTRCEAVTVVARLDPPRALGVVFAQDGVDVATVLAGADGVARWALGPTEWPLAGPWTARVDGAAAVPLEGVVTADAHTLAVDVVGPNPAPGAALTLGVTAAPPLLDDTVIEASGFVSTPAGLAGTVPLDAPNPFSVRVVARRSGRVVACADLELPLDRTPDLRLGVSPRRALPGEPVLVEAVALGGARVALGVDDVVLAERAVAPGDGPLRVLDAVFDVGPFEAFARLYDAQDRLLVERRLNFVRESVGPGAQVTVEVPDLEALREAPVDVWVRLSEPRPRPPVYVEGLRVAVLDLELTRIVAERTVRIDAAVDAPFEASVPVDLRFAAVGRYRTVATALDPDGRRVGLGQGRLDLAADLDAPAIQDAAPPADVPDFGDPSVDPVDMAFDLGLEDPAADLALEDVVVETDARVDAVADALVDAMVDAATDLDAVDLGADSGPLDATEVGDTSETDAPDTSPPPLDLALPSDDAQRPRPDVREGALDVGLESAPSRRGPTGGCDCAIGAGRPAHSAPWVALALFGWRRRARRARQAA